MKKTIICSALAALFLGTTQAQTLIGFEGHLQQADTFDAGENAGGGFTFQSVFFENYYDTTYDYYTGFAISNTSDNTTPGYGNQYSAAAGSGSNSSTYAMFYGAGRIDFTGIPQSVLPLSIDLCNSTFAALSMRDGDAFSKQFGSPNGADGNPDGTNGEDFFKIIIYALAANGDTISSLDFYLADYRFPNNQDDYILTTWTTVNLSSLYSTTTPMAALSFGFESSDVGAFGMNTPAYCAMDKLLFSTTAGMEETNKLEAQAYPNPFVDRLRIENAHGRFSLRNAQGQELQKVNLTGETELSLGHLPSGLYFLVSLDATGLAPLSLVK